MARTFNFAFSIECGGAGDADHRRVEELLQLLPIPNNLEK